jgi:GDP-D-mannose dehydratase
VGLLISDPSKARTGLNWQPAVFFKELVIMMVDADLARQSQDALFLNIAMQM